jgi:protein involved in polysaccharide export with SLBB domain
MLSSFHFSTSVFSVRVFFSVLVLFSFIIAQDLSTTSGASSTMNPSQVKEYEQMYLNKGYSQQQIDLIKNRYGNQFRSPYKPYSQITDTMQFWESDQVEPIFPDSSSDSISLEKEKKDEKIKLAETDTTEELPYFGYSLFKKIPDAFKPNAIGPVDPGYLVGPGDVLRLSVWGQVEFQYELQVSKEGKIFIPVAGQVYVTGIPFEQLQQKIKNLLSKHYSGLSSIPPRTFMDLTVAQLKPIRIFIMGEVASPGGYTVSSASTAFNALYSIGGPLTNGSLRDIKVLRNGSEIATVDFYQYMLTGKCTTDVRLQNNDVVFVPSRGKTVAVTGSVFRPAIYELKAEDNLQALLGFCGGLLPSTNIDRAQIYRTLPFDQRDSSKPVVNVIDLSISKYLKNKEDFVLHNNDTLKITPLIDDLKNYVTLEGAVYYPGVYQCDSLSLRDLIFNLGKPLEHKAFLKRADLIRRNDDQTTTITLPIDLIRLREDPSYDIPLKPLDEVIIYEKDVEKPTDVKIIVTGEVNNPDTYSLSTNLTVTDALLRAGGFTRKAYRKSVDVYRINQSNPDRFTEIFKIDLPDSLNYADESIRNFILQDGDRVVVRPDPSYIVDHYVTIEGLVKFRGSYAIYKPGERLSELIRRAGGLLPDAFLEGATITRNNKRLVVNFKDALYSKESKEDVLLQKGDIIFIPPRPNTVFVHGNVNNPGLFSYIEKTKVKDYIDRAGGLADSSSYIFLTSPTGETKKIKKRGFYNPMVQDGSEIYVTRKTPINKPEKSGPSISEVIRDTLAILASAATVLTLAIRLK